MPICELCDRLTIAQLKHARLDDSEIDKNLLAGQIAYYKRGVPVDDRLNELINSLLDINGQMWDAEHDIRKGVDDSLPLEIIGERAIKIRNLNRIRVSIKNEISLLFQQPEFLDCKMNHLSSAGDT
jgi:hypothetical protein